MNAAAITAIAISAIMLSSVGMVSSYAQIASPVTSAPITLTPDQESYATGERVTINGMVTSTQQGALTIFVTAPNGNRVLFAQPSVENNQFTVEFTAGGPLWASPGTYTVKATYGPTGSLTATTTIEYGGGAPTPEPEPEPEPVSPIDAMLAGVVFEIVGGEVVSIAPGASGAPSIEIVVNASDDGSLTISIPRSILDSRTEGAEGDDVPFSVLIDGEIVDAVETNDPTTRNLVISFFAGDGQVIEIIGSFIVPEFGTVAMLVLAVAIISIVAVSARSRLSILPRY